MTAAVFLAVVVMTAQPAAAEFFTYITSVSPPPVVTPGGVTISITQQSYNFPGDNLDASPSGTDIVFGAISVTGITLGSTLENVNIPYNFQVSISNYDEGLDVVPTGPAVIFNISGTLSGTVGAGKKVNIANVFSQTSITQLVGGENYKLNLFSYVPPGIFNSGAFGAHVETVPIPEPSTIVLLGLGVLTLATPAYKRWRRISPRTSGSI